MFFVQNNIDDGDSHFLKHFQYQKFGSINVCVEVGYVSGGVWVDFSIVRGEVWADITLRGVFEKVVIGFE